MKHFWIAFIIIIFVMLLAGHGILTVWLAQVRVKQYGEETNRLQFIENACSYMKEGRDLAFRIDGQTIKCSDVRIDFVPSKIQVQML